MILGLASEHTKRRRSVALVPGAVATLKTIGQGLLVAVGILMAGCASVVSSDTQPLPEARLEPLGAEHISRGGYRLDSLPVSKDAPDLVVLVAFSGGGKRSAAFGYGALRGMREVMVSTPSGPRPLLDQVDAISGVSGGSFPAAYYGLHREQTFGGFERDFLYSDTNSYIYGTYLLPWNWGWLVDPGVGTNDYMERAYDRTMFRGATFRDLEARGRPLIAIGATDIAYGTPILFNQDMFDVICSDLSALPVARAVAASNGFPGLFSPVTLTNHAARCGGRRPGWLRRIGTEERQNPLSRAGAAAIRTERYLDAERTRYVHLADGGIADNLAMRAAGSTTQAMSTADLRESGHLQVRRVLMISVDGQGAQDSSVARRRTVGGLFQMLGLVSGAQIDSYNFETLITVTEQLNALTDRLRQARCAQGRLVNGVPCGDVSSELVHISLTGRPESPEKDRLLAIPTGLTLERDDVDLLVRAGYEAVLRSPRLRTFLGAYPAAAVAPRPAANAGASRRAR
ncbi:patatin-like phospholipase family protein [Roseomonas eburnea]|uniref:Patatin-like phospholipase family protein n=1 Tax=Neoroseomonas eburnea TaxID=1346889 RepID=A0A9X9XG41_9PROT|nr:patatin-like phospholipase family protein [Neoroseomonas eburnea]MBR0682677.1 patatin-like phospholipase family protein [Neoroseomonas eburnea]